MISFDDLLFDPNLLPHTSPCPYDEVPTISFPNGYGARVIPISFPLHDSGRLYKLSMLVERTDGWHACYNTRRNHDVVAILSPDEVTRWLNLIEALPKDEEE